MTSRESRVIGRGKRVASDAYDATISDRNTGTLICIPFSIICVFLGVKCRLIYCEARRRSYSERHLPDTGFGLLGEGFKDHILRSLVVVSFSAEGDMNIYGL